MAKPDEPHQPEPADEVLANALEGNAEWEDMEAVAAREARIVASYFNTLTEQDIPMEAALGLTQQWMAVEAR